VCGTKVVASLPYKDLGVIEALHPIVLGSSRLLGYYAFNLARSGSSKSLYVFPSKIQQTHESVPTFTRKQARQSLSYLTELELIFIDLKDGACWADLTGEK